MNVYSARVAVLFAAPIALGACALLVGLEEHEPYPAPPGDGGLPPEASIDAADGSTCGDTRVDPNNCGACGTRCAPGYACIASVCGNRVVSVAAGGHACVLLHGGEVWCWGGNGYSQLGTRPDGCGACPAPLKVSGISDAVGLSVGVNASCVRSRTGEVWCWGLNSSGQLGHTGGDVSCGNGLACNPTPQKVPLLVPAVQISVGEPFACARAADGSVRCWGDNSYGALGNAVPSLGPHPTPSLVTITSDVVDIAAGRGYETTCATKIDGTIWCWGENFRGQLGHTSGGDTYCPPGVGSVSCNATPSPIPGFSGFVSPSASRVACARSGDAGYYCWGYNGFGQLGIESIDPVDHATPVPVITAKAAVLSPGYNHACALDVDGVAWCWGYNFWGVVGDGSMGGSACEGGSPYCVLKAVRVTGVPKLAAISAGAELTLALGVDGSVWAWGANIDGRTGHAPGLQEGGTSDDMCVLDSGIGGGPCTRRPARVLGLP